MILAQQFKENIGGVERDIFHEAPPPPKKTVRSVLVLVGSLLVLWWSFEGAKIKPTELMEGIPQIAVTIGRMLPPDFTKVTDAKSYFFPEEMPLSTLLLPVPVSGDQARIKQRWWNNTFPQTIVGATIETIQMALTGTFLALVVAFPIGFLAARNTTPNLFVYHGTRLVMNFLRTIPDPVPRAIVCWGSRTRGFRRHSRPVHPHNDRTGKAPFGIGGEHR